MEYLFGKKEDPPVKFGAKVKHFIAAHWRGVLCTITPLAATPIVLIKPLQGWQWCAFCLAIMAVFWVTESIPLPVTSFMPVFVFPLSGIMTTQATASAYLNNTVLVFLGSLLLATSVEQSGLHTRLALCAIRTFGYSHYKILFAMMYVTMFASMWLTNTAATSMMVPINTALLKDFENQKMLKMFDGAEDSPYASDITTCYFCAVAFSSTIGGIGTLIGTGTNLVFKGLMETNYPKAPEYLSFPMYSAFAVPYMLVIETWTYFCMILMYLGFLRPNSKAAKASVFSEEGVKGAKETVRLNTLKIGRISYWEIMVLLLFGGAIMLFFCRSPQIFYGWGDGLAYVFGVDRKFIKDSTIPMGVTFLMVLLPSTPEIFKNFRVKYKEQLPKAPCPSVLHWNEMDAALPWSFMFLLGGGFALSKAAKKENTDFNGVVGTVLSSLKDLPSDMIVIILIMFTIFVTNFASNVAVANVIVPIGMTLAEKIKKNPLMYNLASGISASYCFCLPVGTPGNLVIQVAAKIPTSKMIIAGSLPTAGIIMLTWAALRFWAPLIWPDISKSPDKLSWAAK